MKNCIFGFIGAGNMGGALASATAKTIPPENIMISCASAEKAQRRSEQLGCTASSNREIAAQADFIFLGVKPQMMGDMLAGIRPILSERKTGFTLVSMAAGMSVKSVLALAGGNYPMIRIMPNTPAAVGEGMILYTANDAVSEQNLNLFTAALSGAGRLDRIDEKLIDAASAVSGCGPAFVYLFIEALADGGVECGLPRDKAIQYAAQTVLGSAKTLLETGKHPGQLKDAVCSPGGTTIAGVHALEESAFRAAAMNAVKAAYEKTLSIGK